MTRTYWAVAVADEDSPGHSDYIEMHPSATEADARDLFNDEVQAMRNGRPADGCAHVRLLRCEVVAELVEHLDGTLAVEPADLPPPTGNGRPVLPDVLALPGLTDAARAIIEAQAAKGRAKYGRPLGYDDGRGPRDLHEELADALMYAMREYGPDHTLTRSALSLLLQALRAAGRDDDNPEARDAQAMRMGRWIEGREVSDG